MTNEQEKLRIGVSACLLGELVRYDGQHKRDSFIADRLAPFVDYVPVCPEVEVGMGVPREIIQLQSRGEEIAVVAPRSGKDWTAPMEAYSERRVEELKGENLCGYILKARSPSCGMERVKVHHATTPATRDGQGVFARVLLEQWPELPVEEEGRLNDLPLRENFCARLFARRRLLDLFANEPSRGEIVAFHTREKFLLLSHNETIYREMGRLVADVGNREPQSFAADYQKQFMACLERPAGTRRHTNVMQHLLGFFRQVLSASARNAIAGSIESYRRKLTPLVAPLTLIRHYAEIEQVEYLQSQTYLAPYPEELMLRNHVA